MEFVEIHRLTPWLYLGLTLLITAPVSASESRKNWPQEETGAEIVKKVFDVSRVRPLDPSSFAPLRQYFSAKQRRNIDDILKALDRLVAKRDRVAEQAGMTDSRWWPPGIDLDVHLLLKGDPLTDRSGLPDTLSISKPRRADNGLEIVATESYIATAQDGSDLGGVKTCYTKLVREDDRWTIDEITFTIRQYGRVKTTTLSRILQEKSRRLRELEKRIGNFKNDVKRPTQ